MIDDVSHVIQLCTAPVFLVMGVGSLLTVFSNRLGRVFDRARVIEKERGMAEPDHAAHMRAELKALVRRARAIYLAMGFAAFSALLVTVLIAAAFVSAILKVELSRAIAALFVTAMISFSAALVAFLREVYVASTTLRLRIDFDDAALSLRTPPTGS